MTTLNGNVEELLIQLKVEKAKLDVAIEAIEGLIKSPREKKESDKQGDTLSRIVEILRDSNHPMRAREVRNELKKQGKILFIPSVAANLSLLYRRGGGN